MGSVEVFASHLEANASRYFGDRVDLSSLSSRRVERLRNSTFYQFSLDTGNGTSTVLYKSPIGSHHQRALADGGRRKLPDELRIFPKADPQTKGRHEFDALKSIEHWFEERGDSRFGTIKVLDYLDSSGALVMEKLENAVGLLDEIGATSRLRRISFGGKRVLESVERHFLNAGAWLAEFHQAPSLAHTQDRYRCSDEWLDLTSRMVDYLSPELPGTLHQELAGDVERFAAGLPAELPLALTHGDFAPRNILIADNSRIVVLDTNASWRAPLYFDLASFFFAMKTPALQLTSLGAVHDRSTLHRFQEAFLQGYFAGRQIPRIPLLLFEIQQLLAFRVSLANQGRKTRGLKGSVKRARSALWSLTLNSYLKSLLEELESHD